MSDDLKILAISSFPVVGNAGIKNMMSILGTHLLPVPTVLISGLGHIPGHQRFEAPLEGLLGETLTMAEERGYRVVLYVGYLREAGQVDIILEAIEKFDHLIKTIIVDPICGDNGQAYVKEDIIAKFPRLLCKADWALPNETEVRILSANDFKSDLTDLLQKQLKRYPHLQFIVTGVKVDHEVCNYFLSSTSDFKSYHPWINKPLSGTGDTYAALFIYFYFIKKEKVSISIQMAGQVLVQLIQKMEASGDTELTVAFSSLIEILKTDSIHQL